MAEYDLDAQVDAVLASTNTSRLVGASAVRGHTHSARRNAPASSTRPDTPRLACRRSRRSRARARRFYSLYLVAHSQGTLINFVKLAKDASYAQKVSDTRRASHTGARVMLGCSDQEVLRRRARHASGQRARPLQCDVALALPGAVLAV